MEENPHVLGTHRATPLSAGVTAWAALAAGGVYLVLLPRPGAAFGTWDIALQIVMLLMVFAVIPMTAVHGLDLYRAHVAKSPEREPRHRAGLVLHFAAGVVSIVAWLALLLSGS